MAETVSMSWLDKLRGGKTAPPAPSRSAESVPSIQPQAKSGPSPSAVVSSEAPPATAPSSPAASKFLNRVSELQAIPGVATQLLQTLDDPMANANAIAEQVRRDQALMAVVLRIANSAYYRSSGQVKDITESIIVLGYDTTRQLVLGQLSRKVLRKNDAWQKALWRHALATALGAQACARQIRGVTVGHAFTAGLLHDIGKAVMHEAYPDECVRVWKALTQTNRPSHEAEREEFGTDHCEVGAELLKRWQFPQMYEQAAMLHSRTDTPLTGKKEQRLVSMVALSGAVASWLGHGAVPDQEGPEPIEHFAIADLGTTSSILGVMRSHIEEELRPLLDIFG